MSREKIVQPKWQEIQKTLIDAGISKARVKRQLALAKQGQKSAPRQYAGMPAEFPGIMSRLFRDGFKDLSMKFLDSIQEGTVRLTARMKDGSIFRAYFYPPGFTGPRIPPSSTGEVEHDPLRRWKQRV